MRVLVDQNLPQRLVRVLTTWPWMTRVEHVFDLGWSRSDDRTLWAAMSAEPGMIFTKDKDFGALSATLGFPPKIVLLRVGNCSVEALLGCVDHAAPSIEAFAVDETKGLLIVDPAP